MWVILSIVGVVVAFLFWELYICEGAHMGRRFVVLLYDLAANYYDRIKSFDTDWERRFLGEPIANAASSLEDALLLDVGAGTGRLARALPPLPNFQGTLVCLEPSKRMVARGRSLTDSSRSRWVRAWAVPLPFEEGAFDMVVSLEILEFTPNPLATLSEMIRVLRRGGWLVVTNRVGWEAPLILGRTFQRSEFPAMLEGLGLEAITVYPWQLDYDLTWACKSYET
jgi:SAM-dependent methyltransferase